MASPHSRQTISLGIATGCPPASLKMGQLGEHPDCQHIRQKPRIGQLQDRFNARARSTLRGGWIELIERYEWQWFCSLTFRADQHPEAANRKYRWWIAQLNRSLFGSRWYRKPEKTAFWIRTTERQDRDVVHFHALVGCSSKDLRHAAIRRYWSMRWNQMAGFSSIQAIGSKGRVSRYMTKCVARGGEMDVSPNLSRFAAQNRVKQQGRAESHG